jgi:hypothetical protein
MRSIDSIERELDTVLLLPGEPAGAGRLLALAEEVLEAWVAAQGEEPTGGEREGFRLLALHHQGTRGMPSFNACRETCREICYHHNLLTHGDGGAEDPGRSLRMMAMLVRHLALFVGGKLQVGKLGDFCCSSRSLRQESAIIPGEFEGRSANA